MSSEPSISSTAENSHTACERPFHHSLCWGAVLAGTVVAISIHVLLTALGVGAGLAVCGPVAYTLPAAHFSAGAALVCSLFAIIAVSFGGWVAGRYSGCLRSGLLHGILVWGLTLILALPWFALGTGLALARAMKNHHEALRISSQAATIAGNNLANTVGTRSYYELGSFVKEAVQSIPTNAAPKAATRAEREVGLAVTKLFAPENTAAFQANRLEAINTLMVYTEMSAADATTTMDAWITSHKNLQAELDKVKAELNNQTVLAEQTASAAADTIAVQRADHLSRAAKWSFFALLIGLLGAALGGRCGAKCASWRSGYTP